MKNIILLLLVAITLNASLRSQTVALFEKSNVVGGLVRDTIAGMSFLKYKQLSFKEIKIGCLILQFYELKAKESDAIGSAYYLFYYDLWLTQLKNLVGGGVFNTKRGQRKLRKVVCVIK